MTREIYQCVNHPDTVSDTVRDTVMTDYDEDEPMRRRPRDVITISDSDDEKAPAPAPKMLPRAPFPSLNLSRPLFSSKAKKPADRKSVV